MKLRIAIVAALQREVRPVIKHWQAVPRAYQGTKFTFYENQAAVLVCGGIGPEAARRATQAIIALYQPEQVISVGFAGALDSALKVGALFVPSRVVDLQDNSSFDSTHGKGVLVSSSFIATAEQKSKLASTYAAQAVDMEAAAVARGAQARGIHFLAVKAISDESTFEMPPLDRFIRNHQFSTTSFVVWAALRPWLWPRVIRLAKNSSLAAKSLSRWLDQYNHPEFLDNQQPGLHLITRP